MSSLPPFITRFGLGDDADERAVKRAYARELKQIDQELDPAAFQDLREARDAALYWLQVRQYELEQERQEQQQAQDEIARQAAPDVGAASNAQPAPGASPPEMASAPLDPPPDPARGEPAAPPELVRYEHRHPELVYPDDPAPAPQDLAAQPARGAVPQEEAPEAIGTAVFGEFADELGVSSQFGHRVLSPPQLKQQLERFLDDPRLMQIDAKDVFEWHIARMLAQGWRPGHETLMEVAAARFEWSTDRRRLYRFGPAGQVLDRYMQELSAFDQEDEPTRRILVDTLRNLRFRAEPPPDEPESMRRAEYLAARFPHLLGLLASADNFENWRKISAGVQQREERAARAASDEHQVRGAAALAGNPSNPLWETGKVIAIFFAVIASLMALAITLSPSPPNVGSIPTAVKHSADSANKPLGEAALAAVLNSTIGPVNCQTVADYAQERGIGTTYPRATLGKEFDRFVLSCVTGGNWPGKLENDVVLASSIARLKGQADYENLVKEAQARLKVAQILAEKEARAAALAAKAKPEPAPAEPYKGWGKLEFAPSQSENRDLKSQQESERLIKETRAKQEANAAALQKVFDSPGSVQGNRPAPPLRGQAWYKGENERPAGVAPAPADKRYEWDKTDYNRIKQDLDPLKLGEPHYGGSAKRGTDDAAAPK